jgi:signal transduction histidine kinase
MGEEDHGSELYTGSATAEAADPAVGSGMPEQARLPARERLSNDAGEVPVLEVTGEFEAVPARKDAAASERLEDLEALGVKPSELKHILRSIAFFNATTFLKMKTLLAKLESAERFTNDLLVDIREVYQELVQYPLKDQGGLMVAVSKASFGDAGPQLKQKYELAQRFAHDLKNPLSALAGNIEAAVEELAADDTKIISAGLANAQSLILDLTDAWAGYAAAAVDVYSRALEELDKDLNSLGKQGESRDIEVFLREFDSYITSEFIEHAVNLSINRWADVRQRAIDRSWLYSYPEISMDGNFDALKDQVVLADTASLVNVVVNTIQNACEITGLKSDAKDEPTIVVGPAGKGEERVKSIDAEKVVVKLRNNNGQFTIQIIDNGKGMPSTFLDPSSSDFIFNLGTTPGGGTGVGLKDPERLLQEHIVVNVVSRQRGKDVHEATGYSNLVDIPDEKFELMKQQLQNQGMTTIFEFQFKHASKEEARDVTRIRTA